MAEKTILQAIREAMYEEMERDPRVLVLGEDVGPRGGVFGLTEGFYDKFGPGRVVDTPLAESLIVGVAIGMALNGLRPIAEIQFADFIWPAFDQIVSEAARMYYRSNGDWNVPMVIRAPSGGGVHVHGALYHSQSVEATFAHIPGLKVVYPSTPYDAKGLLKAALRDPNPVIYLEHKGSYRRIKGEVPDTDYTVPIGQAVVRREGRHVTAITWGIQTADTLEAAEQLAKQGVETTVVDLRTITPLDTATIVQAAKRTGKVLIIHEANRTGGFGAEVAARIAEEALFDLDAPIRRLTGPDVPGIAFNETLAAEFMPTTEKIAAALRELAAF